MTNLFEGKLFVFEGPDNVGKTTIAKAISKMVNKERPSKYVSFPGKDPYTIGGIVYKIHHDKSFYNIKELESTSLQALHIAAHIDSIKRIILPLLKQGTTIILDRYWWSSFVYSQYLGCDMSVIEQLIQAELIAWGKIQPEIIFHIKRDIHTQNGSSDVRFLASCYQELVDKEKLSQLVVDIDNIDLSSTIENVMKFIKSPSGKAKASSYPEQGSLLLDYVVKKIPKSPPSSLEKLLSPTVVFDTYWRFAAERQEIFFARLSGKPKPWTADSILNEHKFTNAYRASDRVSQFLLKNVIYDGSQDISEVFFRIILFKIFNKIETWELLKKEVGEITFSSFNFSNYDSILTKAIENGIRIYSAAYIMPTGGRGSAYERKHRMHLDLIRKMMTDELPSRIANANSMGKVFELLKSYPGIGDFLAYQYATDINYSELTNFPETQFVVAGPGAKDGIRKCFAKTGGLSDAEIIKVVMEHQEEEFNRLGLDFKTLWGRPLKLIDCQNLFCETDKYARVKHPEVQGLTGRSRIKQKFHPNPRQIDYWYPPKWGINEAIQAGELP